MRVVCVEWSDAHGNAFAVYETHEIPHAAAIVQTYGVVLREDDAGISLANEVFAGGTYRGVTFIPRGMIRSISDVNKKPRKRKGPAVDIPDD